MTKTIHGKVCGRTIELDEDLGILDGQEVEVTVRPVKARRPWGEGIKRSAGVAADEPEFDEVFQQIARDRKAATFRESDL